VTMYECIQTSTYSNHKRPAAAYPGEQAVDGQRPRIRTPRPNMSGIHDISQTTFINHKRPNMSGIHNILQTTHSKVHTISSSQVHTFPSSTISETEIESNCKRFIDSTKSMKCGDRFLFTDHSTRILAPHQLHWKSETITTHLKYP
jgi:hypothetical protein